MLNFAAVDPATGNENPVPVREISSIAKRTVEIAFFAFYFRPKPLTDERIRNFVDSREDILQILFKRDTGGVPRHSYVMSPTTDVRKGNLIHQIQAGQNVANKSVFQNDTTTEIFSLHSIN